jgi:ribosome-binding factor A
MRRPERVAELLREELVEIVGFELEDPRVQAVTVTDVRVADDLRDAKVFVLIDGEEKEISEALSALRRASPYIRQQLGLNLSMRHTPHLHFARDTVEERAARIASVLTELKAHENETQERSADGE